MDPLVWLGRFAAFFKNGGPFMYVILATGLVILALSLERFWVIQRAAALNSAKLSRDLLRLVRRGTRTAPFSCAAR